MSGFEQEAWAIAEPFPRCQLCDVGTDYPWEKAVRVAILSAWSAILPLLFGILLAFLHRKSNGRIRRHSGANRFRIGYTYLKPIKMPLSVGDKLGHYEVISLLGQGGMGEVYRARDTTLKRDVALKVLPATVLGDPERMLRFQREAEVLASLDQPNIGPIYGIIDSDQSRGLVLALIEGATLADQIALGLLLLDDALSIARQIIEALEYAHERGVVHRDSETRQYQDHPRRSGQSAGLRTGQGS